MKTINQLIEELTVLRDKHGGNVQVCVEFNGITSSGEKLGITEIFQNGFFIDENELYYTNDFEPKESDKITKFITIYSNRERINVNNEN